jgi:fatty acid-binding protein DegV
MMSPQPNFREMSLQELRRYVLVHRDDEEAWQEFTHRERPNAIYFDTDMPLPAQAKKLQELLQQNDYGKII